MINKATWSYFDRCLEVTLYHKFVLLSKTVCACIELAKQSLSTPVILHFHAFIFHCHVELSALLCFYDATYTDFVLK